MGWFDFLKSDKKIYKEGLEDILSTAFPGGNEEVEKATMHLYVKLRGALDKDEAMKLLLEARGLLVVAEDKSEKRLVDYILRRTENKLSLDEAKIVYKFITNTKATGS